MKTWHRKLALVFLFAVAIFLAWFWLLPNGGNPRTVKQAVNLLIETLPEEYLDDMAATAESDLVGKYHFSLGMGIRNDLGLWQGNLRLVLSTGRLSSIHADYASGHIINALWRELQKRDR